MFAMAAGEKKPSGLKGSVHQKGDTTGDMKRTRNHTASNQVKKTSRRKLTQWGRRENQSHQNAATKLKKGNAHTSWGQERGSRTSQEVEREKGTRQLWRGPGCLRGGWTPRQGTN